MLDGDDLKVIFLPDVLANASPGSCAKLEHGGFHLFKLGWVGFQPTLRPEVIDVLSEDLGSAVDYPGVAANNCTTWDVLAQDLHALGWHNALED